MMSNQTLKIKVQCIKCTGMTVPSCGGLCFCWHDGQPIDVWAERLCDSYAYCPINNLPLSLQQKACH